MLFILEKILSIIKNELGDKYKYHLFSYSEKEAYSVCLTSYTAGSPPSEFDTNVAYDEMNIQVNLQTDNSVAGVRACLHDADAVRSALGDIINPDDKSGIIRIKPNGSINYLNQTRYNLPLATFSFNIKYNKQ